MGRTVRPVGSKELLVCAFDGMKCAANSMLKKAQQKDFTVSQLETIWTSVCPIGASAVQLVPVRGAGTTRRDSGPGDRDPVLHVPMAVAQRRDAPWGRHHVPGARWVARAGVPRVGLQKTRVPGGIRSFI